jgi:hypothetical protein
LLEKTAEKSAGAGFFVCDGINRQILVEAAEFFRKPIEEWWLKVSDVCGEKI